MAEADGSISSVVGSAGDDGSAAAAAAAQQGSTGGGGEVDLGSTGSVAASSGSDAGSSASSSGGPVMGSTAASTAMAAASTAGSTAGAAGKGNWPENWRETASKGDVKLLARLGRYDSPQAIIDALVLVQDRIAKGELRSALPKNATAEQVAAWRAEVGVPETADKYDLKLNDGLVVGEVDKPIIDEFLKSAHTANMSNTQVSAAVQWYYDEQERQSAERDTNDRETQQKTEDALHQEWGKDYRVNMTIAKNLLSTAPAGFAEQFLHGRLADGTPMGSSVAGLQWLARMAREINPMATVVPNGGTNIAGAIDSEIKEIETMMKNPRDSKEGKKYWGDEKVQARYRELLAARDAGKAQGAAA